MSESIVHAGILEQFRPELEELAAIGANMAHPEPPIYEGVPGSLSSLSDRRATLEDRLAIAAARGAISHIDQAVILSVMRFKAWQSVDTAMAEADGALGLVDRIRSELDRHRGIIAYVGEASLGLYGLRGEADLKTTKGQGRSESWSVKLAPGGNTMLLEDADEVGFPDSTPQSYPLDLTLLDGRFRLQKLPWAEAMRFDPASESYGPPVIYLGRADQPSEELNVQLKSDALRYAMRFVAHAAKLHEGLSIAPPGDRIQHKVTLAFARLFADIIRGRRGPGGAEPAAAEFTTRPRGQTPKDIMVKRARPLSQYGADGRANIWYAAGTDLDMIEASTRQMIGLAASESPMVEARATSFFARLRQAQRKAQ